MLHGQTLSDGNIVAFRRPMTSLRPSSPPPEAERGMILLFTGTRYERVDHTACSISSDTARAEPDPIGHEGH